MADDQNINEYERAAAEKGIPFQPVIDEDDNGERTLLQPRPLWAIFRGSPNGR